MPRPLRIEYPNAWYHVMNRGAGRRKIFLSDHHRKLFLEILKESTEMFGIEIHAYCLMGNHYHLLIRTPNANLSRAMRHINGVYTQRFNRLQKTDGSLFRGRYKAVLVDEDCYLLLVSRYIHLNPVEAKLVNRPKQYTWSSYAEYLKKKNQHDWLVTDIIKKRLSETKSLKHVRDYQDYVENYDHDELALFESNKYTSPILGTKEFTEDALNKVDNVRKKASLPDVKRAQNIPSLQEIIFTIAKHFEISTKDIKTSKRGNLNHAKLVCIYISRKRFGYSLAEIADVLSPIGRNTVSSNVNKYERLLKDNDDIRKKYKVIISEFDIKEK